MTDQEDRDRDDIRVLLNRLTATFDVDSCAGDIGEIDDAFEYVVAQFPADAAKRALHVLLLGKGDEQDPKYLPTAPQLAVECQHQVYLGEAENFAIVQPADPLGERIAALEAEGGTGLRLVHDVADEKIVRVQWPLGRGPKGAA